MAAVCICPLNLTEKLLVAQIVKKFLAFYETRAFITACTTPCLKTVECERDVRYASVGCADFAFSFRPEQLQNNNADSCQQFRTTPLNEVTAVCY
jgi:hypothetical protein